MRSLCLVVLLVVTATSVATPPDVYGPSGECICVDARMKNRWCRPCAVGYVANVPIRSHLLFEALDAHGHELDPEHLPCDVCHNAYRTDRWCRFCRRGFVDKQAYFSSLTWLLAQGEVMDPAKLDCGGCKTAVEICTVPELPKLSWCTTCEAGMIGNVRLEDPKLFTKALVEYTRLLHAIEISRRCERCGVASMFDRRCFLHDLRFQDGMPIDGGELPPLPDESATTQPVTTPPPPPPPPPPSTAPTSENDVESPEAPR